MVHDFYIKLVNILMSFSLASLNVAEETENKVIDLTKS